MTFVSSVLISPSVFLNEVYWYLNYQQVEQIVFLSTLQHNFLNANSNESINIVGMDGSMHTNVCSIDSVST